MPAAEPELQRAAVSPRYVRLLYAYLAAQGVDAVALLGGPAPDEAELETLRYPMARWRRLLQRAAEQLHDPLLGLHLGRTISPRDLGLLGYLILSCGTLGAALQRYEHYERLFYDASAVHSAIDGDEVVLQWGTEAGAPGPLVDECAIAALVQIARDISATPLRCAVQFINPRPAQTAPYADYFGGAVAFDADCTQVRLALRDLALPLRSPDPLLLRVVEQQAELSLQGLGPRDDALHAVRAQIARQLRAGEPTAERIAAGLNTSTRSLHRRLAAAGLNYRRLLEQTRHALARDYLANPQLQIAEIALLLGYSEQSAFTRAFRRWSGLSPIRYRQSLDAAREA